MESLYDLMNINTERKLVKSITFWYLVTFIPLPHVPKVVYGIVPPRRDTSPHLMCRDQLLLWIKSHANREYLYLRGGGNDLKKTFLFSIRYNDKTYDFSFKKILLYCMKFSKINVFINFDRNTAKSKFLKN